MFGETTLLVKSMALFFLKSIIYLIPVFIVSFAPSTHAQDVLDVKLKGEVFKEGYSNTLDVSAGIIVGLSLGGNTGITSLKETFIAQPHASNQEAICLRINSLDGLFWSENEYSLENVSTTPASKYMRFAPLTRSFLSQLKGYGAGKIIGYGKTELSTDSIKTSNCETSNYVLYPIQGSAINFANQLRIYINSSNRYTQVELSSTNNDGPTIEAECARSDFDIAAIYDQTCRVEIPSSLMGNLIQAKLLFASPPFGSEEWTETIFIPRNRTTIAEK